VGLVGCANCAQGERPDNRSGRKSLKKTCTRIMYKTKELRIAEFGLRIIRWLEHWGDCAGRMEGSRDKRAFGETPTCFRTGNTSGPYGPVPRVNCLKGKYWGMFAARTQRTAAGTVALPRNFNVSILISRRLGRKTAFFASFLALNYLDFS
jgi:hypothetical protein